MNKICKSAMLAMIVLCSAAGMAAVPEVLTYRGQLSRTGGFAETGENLTLTFKLYDSLDPATVLWGRSVVVTVDKYGVFYADLKDDNGAVVQEAVHTDLLDAVASAKGAIEVGLTPPGAGEILPRQTLTTGVRASRAARTKAVDVFYAQNMVVAEKTAIDELCVDSVTVTNGTAQLPPVCYLAPVAEQSVGGGKGSVTLKGLSPARSASPYAPAGRARYTTKSAACDMVLTYENDEGAFSVILPKGCNVDGETADVRTVNATSFGKAN
jgi:hypothetical protein